MKRFFTAEHEWFDLVGELATVGITHHAQSLLGDIVYVELPVVGTKVEEGASVAVVESVKAASDVYSPLGGEVVETNEALRGDPATINSDPQGGAWLFKLRIGAPPDEARLMDEETYLKSCT